MAEALIIPTMAGGRTISASAATGVMGRSCCLASLGIPPAAGRGGPGQGVTGDAWSPAVVCAEREVRGTVSGLQVVLGWGWLFSEFRL